MADWAPPTPADAATAHATGSAAPHAADQATDTVVQVTNVTKSYGDVVAVSDVSFGVGPGVTALLGPNGAGKSTLFRVMCGLTAPTRGTVTVFGADARADREVRGRIGLSPQQDALFDRLTARRFVEVAAQTHGLVDPEPAARRVLDLVDLDADATKPVGAFSKGMRQRVKLAAALVHDPDLLVLDEPLTGLDPVQRNRMIRLFHEIGDSGKCLLVSSHVLDEVARLGSRVLVIAQGRLAATGDYRDLRNLMDDRPHRIRIAADGARRLAAALVAESLVDGVSVASESLTIDTSDVDAFGRRIAGVARDCGVRLREVEPTDDDLESVFRYLVERR